jgi:asparagine synthase (glutamine-hydrolysing)
MDFYLRRNDINRVFGLETRYPMLDHELVEFCARIPLKLKIQGWFDTKYIFRKSMEPVLPHKIVHREDKLGHSIPLKNWLREVPQVKDFVLDHLSEETIRKRGYFNVAYINRLISDHMSKKRNNSHRLWTLAVLEMWLREHVDNTTG